MLASMLGSSLASRLLSRPNLRVESYMQVVFAVASGSLCLPVIIQFFLPDTKSDTITSGGRLNLLGFCLFEMCVGIFWPSIMKMRSQYIPEESRSTIMNFFRIPLNIFVCIVLANVSAFPISVMFGMCAIFLAMAGVLQRRLSVVSEKHNRNKALASVEEKLHDSEAEPLNV